MKKMTEEYFYLKALEKHGLKYDYSKVEFVKATIPVVIHCTEHDITFEVEPRGHLKGTGCYKCSSRYIDTEVFIRRASNVHKQYYTYPETNYKNNKIKVKIVCPVHGEFEQLPSEHLAGSGCRKCKNAASGQAKRTTTHDFILRSKVVHNNKYTYEQTEYGKGNKDGVIITCPIHGTFVQRPNDHLAGRGCQSCAVENSNGGFDKSKPAILYYLSINNGEAYKIGITNRTVRERYSKTELEAITILDTVYYSIGVEAYREEQRILKEYKAFTYTGPHLLKSGNTELFWIDVLKKDTKAEVIEDE